MTPPIGPYFTVTETARLSEATESERAAINEQWDKVIDKFHDWITHPEEFAEEGMISPSPETISLASEQIVKQFRTLGIRPPHVVADTHGGIVFEHRVGPQFESIRVQADGHIEYCRFTDCKPTNSNSSPTFEEFESAKRAARERLLELPPEEAQARVDSILFPHLWKVINPRDLDWPGDLADDDGDV